MKQIFKNLAPHWRMVLVIVVLLLVQAYCELSLPQYTSDIIDVGIQDGGMEHIVPEKITQERYERILLFMDDQEKALWEETYSVEDGICERKELSEPELDELDQELLLPILIDSQADTEIDALQSGQ
ncbi:MAG: ABC transporter ATP-binding protein, partial [Clostridiaceae bacterium]|nr:ABC transporter ATP-binding protein [Clostridiaceae bacterium]